MVATRGEDMTLALKQISSSSLVQLQLKAQLSFTCTFPMMSVQGCMLSSLQRLVSLVLAAVQYCVSRII